MFPQRSSKYWRALLPVAGGLMLAMAPVPAAAHETGPMDQASRPAMGLFSTLPLYWGEAAELSDLLASRRPLHWSRVVMEREYALEPIDLLAADIMDGLDHLLIAQPRILSPDENVVLDDWVRQGGKLLLFADPMLTGHSVFGIGDPRRPQDVVIISPILARWGLELRYAEEQARGERLAQLEDGLDLPVNLAGQFALLPADAGDKCVLIADALIARCQIGKGEALIVADAALLEEEPSFFGPDRPRVLAHLLQLGFSAK